MNKSAQNWIDNLNLQKHPEGGWFNEVYRSSESISRQHLPNRFNGNRNFSTSIYYLLVAPEISSFHKIKQDELWYFHDGSSLTLHIIDESGEYHKLNLGKDINKKQQPQVIIKAGWIFAASVDSDSGYTLVGCNVAPGFDFDDFEILTRKELIFLFPEQEVVILNYTKK